MPDDLQLVHQKLDQVLSLLNQVMDRLDELETRSEAIDTPLISGEEGAGA